MTSLILISMAVLAADPAPLELGPVEVGKVPRVTAPAQDLPLSLNAPRHGRWVGTDGAELRAGEFLPYPLSIDVRRRLRLLRLYPALCQAAIDDQAEVLGIQHKRAITVLKAQHVVNAVDAQIEVETQSNWGWYEVLGVGVLTALGGLGAGALLWR